MHSKNTLLFFAICWTLIITFLSLVTIGNIGGLIPLPFKDKIVHFVLYFVFVVVWVLYIKTENYTSKMGVIILIIAISYGILMEICQGVFTTNRHADSIDVVANSLGALFGFLYINKNFINKRKI